jgi:demethylmenaquinone methyltransferase/2-methoxy-6-polyprenyl-1,4-benzoquinol methylase
VPRNPIIRFGNNIYFGKIVPKIGALLSDGAAYRYLPKSVA